MLVARGELDGLRASAAADTEPGDIRWKGIKQTALREIGILRDNGEAIGSGLFPNVFVGKSEQPALTGVCAAREKCRQQEG